MAAPRTSLMSSAAHRHPGTLTFSRSDAGLQLLRHTGRSRCEAEAATGCLSTKLSWLWGCFAADEVIHLDCRHDGRGVLCRYLGRKKCVQSVCVQPPFLRPQLTEAQLAAKILDNGIQGDLRRVSFRSSCCLTMCGAWTQLPAHAQYCLLSSPSPVWR